VPKGYIYINIDSPVTIKNNAQIAMTRLFVDLYSDAVVEGHYDAELAGIHYHLYPHQGGMTLQLSGISDKQELLLTELLDELNQFQFDERKFVLLKKQLLTHWKNAENSKAITQLFSKLSSAIQPKNPCAEQLISALSPVTFAQFKQYCQQILKQIAIEVFIHGNWRAQEAKQLTSIIKSAFKGRYDQDFAVEIPILDIQGQGNITLPLQLNGQDNAAVIYYPIANREPDLVAKTMIVSQLLSPAFFQTMRTEKQYGYLVGVSYVPINRYPGIAFYIQSPHVEAKVLTQAIDQFINQCHLLLTTMDHQDWLDLQQSLAGQLQEKDNSLRIRSQRFWTAICNKELDFSGKQQLIDTILALSKADVIQFITEVINKNTVSTDNNADRFILETIQYHSVNNTLTAKDQNIQAYEKIINSLINTCSTKF
jgi:secreted Zn-dependent insulinase-like peptidase